MRSRISAGWWWLPSLLAATLCLLGMAQAAVHDENFQPEHVLEATYQHVQIDCESRPSVVMNGTFPGPALYLREGHTSWIRVYNNMPDQNLTVHWHGLSQRAAPFSDGTPLVSQWPIPPNRFFDYEVRPEKGDAGTYFYHSHVGFQQSTAHGALIVKDAGEPAYEYDDDIILSTGDYYNQTDHEIETGLLGDPFEWSGEPLAVAINGHSGTHSWGDASDSSCTPFVIDVEPDKEYRLRVIGRSVLSLAKIGIEDHSSLQVIEADGEYTTKSEPIDHVQVAPGQRFSYLLKTKPLWEVAASGKTTYWVRYETRDRPESVTGYAILRYTLLGVDPDLPKTLPESSPVKLPEQTRTYLEGKLEPLSQEIRQGFPKLDEVTRTVRIQVNQVLTRGGYINNTFTGPVVWVQNNETWLENVQASRQHDPYLVAFYNNDKTAPNHTRAVENGGFDPVSRTFTAMPGEVLDIVWESNSGPTGGFDFHPMHVHGEHVYDLGAGNGTYDAAANEERFKDGHVPARRDTSVLYRYIESGAPHTTAGWRAWRIRVTDDNVGAWMMHCHVAQHSVMGMNTVWVFGDRQDILRSLGAPPYIGGYLNYGGDAYGDPAADWPPHVNHWLDEEGDDNDA